MLGSSNFSKIATMTCSKKSKFEDGEIVQFVLHSAKLVQTLALHMVPYTSPEMIPENRARNQHQTLPNVAQTENRTTTKSAPCSKHLLLETIGKKSNTAVAAKKKHKGKINSNLIS